MVNSQRRTRIAIGLLAVLGLATVYLIQHVDFLFLAANSTFGSEWHFAFNRAVRILLNDSFMLLLIYALFLDKSIIKLAAIIQIVDLIILFPIYLALKLPAEGASEISSPFLSQLHRLIINPTLMILLIIGVYYQRLPNKKGPLP